MFAVAPVIAAQFAPAVSQRDHAYVNVIPVPVHVPWLAVSVWPTAAWPLIVGGWVLGGPCAAVTAAVAFEAAVFGPSAFAAVTRNRNRNPTSPAPTTYAVVEAPPMTAQSEPSAAPPSAPQRTH